MTFLFKRSMPKQGMITLWGMADQMISNINTFVDKTKRENC